MEFVDTLEAVRILVLSVVVLRKGGTTDMPAAGKPVKAEPSPTCFP